ncbi:hypothetical protein [Streptomyces sp. NPDC059639]|uniref:hypothetical protein n=1 Tax=Streptomyces sp. NPDC059639 TaxID=3346891 RepID=UPI003690694C
MDWVAWGASGAGVLFLGLTIYGYLSRPGTPQDAAIKHATYRIFLPLLLAWFFLWRELPNALNAPWAVDATCDAVALTPVVIIVYTTRRHRRATQGDNTGPVK